MARLPVPPTQVMPPEGTAPVTQDVDTTGQDALSPTTLVLNYLKARGYTPSTENVRRALEANARDPGVIGGLRSDTAATDADDKAAMAAARGNAGGGAGGGDSRPMPVPPIPPTGGAPNTSAAPAPSDGSVSSSLGDRIIAGLGAVLPSAASALLGRGGPPPGATGGIPAPGGPGGPPQLGGPQLSPQLGGPEVGAPQLPAPPPQLVASPPGASATGDSITKSLEGPPSMLPGVQPVQPGAVSGMPTGPSTPDPSVVNEANIRGGFRPAPTVPFRGGPVVGGAAQIPTVRVTPRPVGRLVLR
jgi:hypothetical protein